MPVEHLAGERFIRHFQFLGDELERLGAVLTVVGDASKRCAHEGLYDGGIILDQFVGNPKAADRVVRQVVPGYGKFVKTVAVKHKASRRAEDGRRNSACFEREVNIVLTAEGKDRDVFVRIQ